jgi:hypothetical protein
MPDAVPRPLWLATSILVLVSCALVVPGLNGLFAGLFVSPHVGTPRRAMVAAACASLALVAMVVPLVLLAASRFVIGWVVATALMLTLGALIAAEQRGAAK